MLVVGEVVPTKNLRRGGFCSSGGVMAVAGEGKNAMAMLVEGDALLVLRVEGAEGGGSLKMNSFGFRRETVHVFLFRHLAAVVGEVEGGESSRQLTASSPLSVNAAVWSLLNSSQATAGKRSTSIPMASSGVCHLSTSRITSAHARSSTQRTPARAGGRDPSLPPGVNCIQPPLRSSCTSSSSSFRSSSSSPLLRRSPGPGEILPGAARARAMHALPGDGPYSAGGVPSDVQRCPT